MLRACLIALAMTVCAFETAYAQAPPTPDPFMEGPSFAPGAPSLAGSRWRVTLTWQDGVDATPWGWAEFRPDGQLVYAYADGREWDNGRWRQRGSVLVWDTNSMFQASLGLIDGDRITGTGVNVRGEHATWVFEREGAAPK